MNLAKLLAAFRAYRAGAPLGDVVVLKLDALAAPPRHVADRLVTLSDGLFAPDVAQLRRMPAGSLGREYARFLDANRITPLAVSPALRERFRSDPFALRYTSTHDLHHVLAGFDTGLAGEIGVLAFNVGQGAAPVSRGMLRLVRVLYTIASPTQARAIASNVRAGLAMGEHADLVMAAPVESWLAESLVQVRRRLRIPEPLDAGVLPSGPSVVGRLLMAR